MRAERVINVTKSAISCLAEGRFDRFAPVTPSGVGPLAAATIVAEIGVDVSRFPSAKHLASWAGLGPGKRESGGTHLSGKTRKGDIWLRVVLLEVAWAARYTKGNYLAAQCHRLAQPGGAKRAALAIAHRVLIIIYHLLREGTTYTDLGVDYWEQRDKGKIERQHVRRLEQLGYTVTLSSARAA